MIMDTSTQVNLPLLPLPILPAELWLHILESPSLNEEHLWVSVCHASRPFRDYIERLFVTTYLPCFAISLILPRRDPDNGTLNWTGAILNSQLIMTLEDINQERRYTIFVSPLELKNRSGVQNVRELKEKESLPKVRLLGATTWMYTNKNFKSGQSLQAAKDIKWDNQHNRWVWQIEWRQLITQFYKAKVKARPNKQSQAIHQEFSNSKHRRV
jgi:hypothetical protein